MEILWSSDKTVCAIFLRHGVYFTKLKSHLYPLIGPSATLPLWPPGRPFMNYPFGQPLLLDIALVNSLVSCAWLLGGALEVWWLQSQTKSSTFALWSKSSKPVRPTYNCFRRENSLHLSDLPSFTFEEFFDKWCQTESSSFNHLSSFSNPAFPKLWSADPWGSVRLWQGGPREIIVLL